MSKPNKPPQVTSFALSQVGEESAALALRLLRDLEKKQKQFIIPKGAGELLCWSSDDIKYQSILVKMVRSPGYTSLAVKLGLF